MMQRRPLDEDEFRSYELKSDETKVSARSLMKGAGLTDEQIYRPFIGVCNSYSNFFPRMFLVKTIFMPISISWFKSTFIY